jgi:hypothetical protein
MIELLGRILHLGQQGLGTQSSAPVMMAARRQWDQEISADSVPEGSSSRRCPGLPGHTAASTSAPRARPARVALKQVALLLLRNRTEQRVVDAIRAGDPTAKVMELSEAVDRLVHSA